jgi:hypothetical protein
MACLDDNDHPYPVALRVADGRAGNDAIPIVSDSNHQQTTFLAPKNPRNGTEGQAVGCLGFDPPSQQMAPSSFARYEGRRLSLVQAILERGVRHHDSSREDVVADAWTRIDVVEEMIGSDPPLLG